MRSQKSPLIIAVYAILLSLPTVIAHENGNPTKQAVYQAGYNEGYQAGYQHGQVDYRSRAGFNFRSREYDRADSGYSKSLKYKDDYKHGFREAYALGYRDGYNGTGFRNNNNLPRSSYPDGYYRYSYPDRDDRYRYPERDRSYSYGYYPDRGETYDMGSQRGYQDGLDQGRNDARKGKSYDLNRHDEYRDADKGYLSSYGDKRQYQAAYRRGFEDGYREGYGPQWR